MKEFFGDSKVLRAKDCRLIAEDSSSLCSSCLKLKEKIRKTEDQIKTNSPLKTENAEVPSAKTKPNVINNKAGLAKLLSFKGKDCLKS